MPNTKTQDFIASVTKDVKVIEAMSQSLFALELIHLAGVTIDGDEDVLDFSCEIEKLKAALHVMGVEDDVREHGGAKSRSGDYTGPL